VAWVRKRSCGRLIQWDHLVAACSMRDDTERSLDMIRQLGDAVDLGVAIDLNADQDKVTRGEIRS
jgi:hypothetical protein